MSVFERGIHGLQDETRLLLAALRDRRLFVSLAAFAALLLLVAQAPLHYAVDIGREEGYDSDLPLVAEFHDPEQAPATGDELRWTTGRSLIRLPGVGQRALWARMRLLPVNAEVAQRGPQEIEVWASGRLVGRAPLRPVTGGLYTFLLPPPADGSGDQVIELRSATFTPTGDQRAIGVPVDELRVESAGGLNLPAWRGALVWLGAALLLWLALRRSGLAPGQAQAALIACVLLAALAALLDPPRFAFGAAPALVVAALGWLLALLAQAAPAALLLAGAALALPAVALRVLLGAPEEYQGWGGPGAAALALVAALLLAGWLRPYARLGLPPLARRWLLLLALLVFMTHYGGKIYPDAMWGDIGFHSNRYREVVLGRVLLLSRNRGVDFPYPPAFYLLLAPFSLLGLDRRLMLQLGGALLDAASPLLVYIIAACGLSCASAQAPASRVWRAGVLAAGIYSVAAATFMTTWWNFSTHIFTQFAHLLLIAAFVALWSRAGEGRGARGDGRGTEAHLSAGISRGAVIAVLFAIQSLVYLGHFGFWINMSLLGGMGLAVLLAGALLRRASWGRFWTLLAGFAAAELFAGLFFYSAYTSLFLDQAQAAAAGGLTGLANRSAADSTILWDTLWDAGFRAHFGFFPLPLALCGLALLARRRTTGDRRLITNRERPSRHLVILSPRHLVTLMAGTFLIALLFAALPFLTGSTLSTRWLMFSAWAVAVGAALAAQLLWRCGRAGRWVVLAMGGYTAWVTAAMWVGALAWRIRPPEPF